MSSAILAPLPARLEASLGLVLVVCTFSACSGDDPAGPETSTETPTPVLTSVSPDILIEGASFVIQGSNFSSSAGDNLVTVDGVGATVIAASATQLTATVPTFDCRPQRTADVQVSRQGRSSGPLATSVRPAAFVDAASGELLLIDDPSDYCLQFPPAGAGSGEYLVGIGSAAERPETLFDVTMTGEQGETAPAPAALGFGSAGGEIANPNVRLTAPARVAPTIRPRGRLGRPGGIVWRSHARAEHHIRRLEREYLQRTWGARMPFASDAHAGRLSSAVGAPPAVGDEIQIKVPTWDATTVEGACTPIQITTEVRVVGQRGIFVTDIENPTTDALTDGEIQAFSDAFDSFIYDADVEYFGLPSDLDGNERIIVVLTVEVNKAVGGQIGGAAFALDLFEPSVCSASDYGELYYHGVPDPENVAGTRPRSKADVTDVILPVISHEFAHILQYSVRLRHGAGSSAPLALWEAEGQASLAIEIVGHAALGRLPGQDYDAAAALSVAGRPWYEGRFLGLAAYYGHDLDGGRHADAPETCTLLFVDPLQDTGCEPGQAYGASWSFFRYVADRYGPVWSGGEAGLMRDWIDRNPTLQGAANVEALLGRPFDALFAEWAAMHYLDARVPDADPDLLMTSWNLGDVLPVLGANTTLEPTTRMFADFSASLLVRGGSTAYSLFTDAAARPATAIRFRDGSGGILGDDMRPVLWVVRTH